MKGKLSLLASLAIFASLSTTPALGEPSGCPEVEPKPWQGAEISGLTQDAADPTLDALAKSDAAGFAGGWYSKDGVLHTAVGGSASVAASIVEATQEGDPLAPPIEIEVVPFSGHELEVVHEKVDAYLSSLQIPFVTEKRPDLGRIIVTIQPENVQGAESQLKDMGPSCVVVVNGDTAISDSPFDISRNDQPPYKGGKHVRVLNPAGTFHCESGFTWEKNGGTTLYGSMSGHML